MEFKAPLPLLVGVQARPNLSWTCEVHWICELWVLQMRFRIRDKGGGVGLELPFLFFIFSKIQTWNLGWDRFNTNPTYHVKQISIEFLAIFIFFWQFYLRICFSSNFFFMHLVIEQGSMIRYGFLMLKVQTFQTWQLNTAQCQIMPLYITTWRIWGEKIIIGIFLEIHISCIWHWFGMIFSSLNFLEKNNKCLQIFNPFWEKKYMEGFYKPRKVVCMELLLLGFLTQCLCH